jgi:serine phosphatase RsbU (regulator of sigma subunit)
MLSYLAGSAVLAAVAAVDLAAGTDVRIIAYLGLVPLVVSAWATPRAALAFGGAATATAVASGVWESYFGTEQHLTVILLVVIQTGIGWYLAKARRRRESELAQQTSELARRTSELAQRMSELAQRESELAQRKSELVQVRAIADVTQRALLPAVPRDLDGVGFATRYLSAAQSASIGGDFYEVVRTHHMARVIVGDVKGKGLPAVRLAAVVLGAFREGATTWLEPEHVAAACTRAVSREADAEDFVTALLVDIHANGRLSLCSAGHHPPVLISASGSVSSLRMSAPSPPLGIAEQFIPTHTRWNLADRLLLFTDGLVEARNTAGEFFPLEGNLAGIGELGLDDVLDEVTSRVIAHVGGNLHDDLAVVLAERRPLADEATPAGAPAPRSAIHDDVTRQPQ